MASNIKNKFAGLLRGLLRHSDESETARPVVPPPTPAAMPAPAPAAMPATAESDASAAARVPGEDEISIPLSSVVAILPMDLKAKLMSTPVPGQSIALSVDKVVGQLAYGTVKIPFGELRQLAPGMFANSGGEFDNRQVCLPLQEILSRLNPALLSRKSAQHKVEVSEEVSGPFDGRGRGISFTTQPLKAAPSSPAIPDLKKVQPQQTFSAPIAFTPPPPAPKPTLPPPRAVTPAPAQDAEVFSFKPRQTAPPAAPIPFTPPASLAPGNGHGNGHSNGHVGTTGNGNGNVGGNGIGAGPAAVPPFKFTTAPAPSAPVNSSAPRPEPAQPKLTVALSDLVEAWPEALRQEIAASPFLANSTVALALSFVDAGLKRGKVTMTWKELRTSIKPNSLPSSHDTLNLELPLKVLAPAFFAAQKQGGKAAKRVQVAEEIPNLFFGFPQPGAEPPAPAAPATPVAPAAPAAPVVAAAAPAAPVASPVPVIPFTPAAPATLKVTDTNFFTAPDDEIPPSRKPAPATDFINRHTHPQEVVARALALHGVAGAVVALADGLRVASQVPADMNADSVSAFLPQIYERVNQSTRELRMGALNNVSFTVGNVPWKIFRINSIYFAAFGRAGEALPKAQLAGLAAELDRKKQF